MNNLEPVNNRLTTLNNTEIAPTSTAATQTEPPLNCFSSCLNIGRQFFSNLKRALSTTPLREAVNTSLNMPLKPPDKSNTPPPPSLTSPIEIISELNDLELTVQPDTDLEEARPQEPALLKDHLESREIAPIVQQTLSRIAEKARKSATASETPLIEELIHQELLSLISKLTTMQQMSLLHQLLYLLNEEHFFKHYKIISTIAQEILQAHNLPTTPSKHEQNKSFFWLSTILHIYIYTRRKALYPGANLDKELNLQPHLLDLQLSNFQNFSRTLKNLIPLLPPDISLEDLKKILNTFFTIPLEQGLTNFDEQQASQDEENFHQQLLKEFTAQQKTLQKLLNLYHEIRQLPLDSYPPELKTDYFVTLAYLPHEIQEDFGNYTNLEQKKLFIEATQYLLLTLQTLQKFDYSVTLAIKNSLQEIFAEFKSLAPDLKETNQSAKWIRHKMQTIKEEYKLAFAIQKLLGPVPEDFLFDLLAVTDATEKYLQTPRENKPNLKTFADTLPKHPATTIALDILQAYTEKPPLRLHHTAKIIYEQICLPAIEKYLYTHIKEIYSKLTYRQLPLDKDTLELLGTKQQCALTGKSYQELLYPMAIWLPEQDFLQPFEAKEILRYFLRGHYRIPHPELRLNFTGMDLYLLTPLTPR